MNLTVPIRQAIAACSDFFFPEVCTCCMCELNDRYQGFCTECRSDLSQFREHRCQVCSASIGPHAQTSRGCRYCKSESFKFKSVSSIGPYTDSLREVLLSAKLGRSPTGMMKLTDLLWELEKQTLQDDRFDLVVPIPHHWTGRIAAWTLPPEIMATRLSHFLKAQYGGHILRKRQRTPRQHDLKSASARKQNLRNAFAVNHPGEVAERRILLVDDVLTTGTTCHRASAELIKAGAAQVDVAVIARNLGNDFSPPAKSSR